MSGAQDGADATAVEGAVAPTSPRSREHWFVLFVASTSLVLFVVLGFVVRPDERGFGTHEQLGLPSCKLLDWTGVPCPGCGVTTSVAFAARGRVLAALHAQPFGLIVALSMLLLPVWALIGHVQGKDLYRTLQSARVGRWGIALGVALAVGWIYKLVVVLAR